MWWRLLRRRQNRPTDSAWSAVDEHQIGPAAEAFQLRGPSTTEEAEHHGREHDAEKLFLMGRMPALYEPPFSVSKVPRSTADSRYRRKVQAENGRYGARLQ